MSTVTREDRLARRISDLYATDQQFAEARPSETVTKAIEDPELRLPQIVQTVIDGYADRPALGQRAVEFVTDPLTGRTSAELLPHFDTTTYRECRTGSTLRRACSEPGGRRSRRDSGTHQHRLHNSTWRRGW
jgi:fatty acid CoA ligase FadD9